MSNAWPAAGEKPSISDTASTAQRQIAGDVKLIILRARHRRQFDRECGTAENVRVIKQERRRRGNTGAVARA